MPKRIKSLKGKSVLITGAAGGIGSALARQLFVIEGSSLILVDKNLDGLVALKSAIENDNRMKASTSVPGDVQVFKVDLTSRSSIQELSDHLVDQHLDILINNAGIVYTGSFAKMDIDDFDRVLDVNLLGTIHLTHMLLPKLIDRRGAIAFVASGTGLMAPGITNAYATSKYGLVGFSEALRAELWGQVGVSTICPAFVATEIMDNSMSELTAQAAGVEKHVNKLGGYVHKFGVAPDKFSNIVIKSIKRNKGLVTFGAITVLSYYAKRFFPRFADFCNAILFFRMKKAGVIK